jgi:hypothetical protein
MIWIVAHAVLGLAVIAWVVRVNPLVRKRPPEGPAVSALEASYLVVGLASWVRGGGFDSVVVLASCSRVRLRFGCADTALRPRGRLRRVGQQYRRVGVAHTRQHLGASA